MRCEKCGKENGPGDAYCMGCGNPLTINAPSPPGPKKKAVPIGLIAVVVAVVVIVVAAVALAGLGNGGDADGGKVNVTVRNSRASSIDYSLYFEGVLVKQGSLAASENAQWSTDMHFEGSSTIAHVQGWAGWGTGSSQQWHNETLTRGGTLNVELEF
jgi:hypothetical protein